MTNAASMAHCLDVLSEAPQAYVGVSTRWGPHVTPELFVVTGERIVCMTAAGTLKSRLLRRARSVACVARLDGRCVSLVGQATVIDPASPATLLRAPRRAVTASIDAARFTVGNLSELTGAAMDLLAGRLGGPIPPHRVVIIIEPRAAVVSDADDVLSETGWEEIGASAPRPPRRDTRAVATPDLGQLPYDLANLSTARDAVVGWTRADGAPLALPATWDHERAEARLPGALFRLCGAAQTSASCVTFDSWSGLGPSGKQGVMLRGSGAATPSGDEMVLRCSVNRVTHWDGITTATVAI